MIENCYSFAWERRSQTLRQWGKDSTGLIEYKINDHGFRSPYNYNTVPGYAFFGNSIVFGIGIEQPHILTSGQKRQGAINLMPHVDDDVSGTHPGPKTHNMWAKTIKLLLNRGE
jgi:hypothetical protein